MTDQGLLSVALSALALLAILFVPVAIVCWREIKAAWHDFMRELH